MFIIRVSAMLLFCFVTENAYAHIKCSFFGVEKCQHSHYETIAVASNSDGNFIPKIGQDEGNTAGNALQQCNNVFGHCSILVLINQTRHACVAISKSGKILYHSSKDVAGEAQSDAMNQCREAKNSTCEIVFTGCN